MAALAHVSASLSLSVHADVCTVKSVEKFPTLSRLTFTNFARFRTAFVAGSPLLIRRSSCQRKLSGKVKSASVRCEQNTQQEDNNLDVWLGRFAMVGFAVAISVEIATGKGLLENFGLTAPLPTVALAVTALVGILTAIFIFQSASKS